ncbi:MAG: DUF5716 family protein [Eubacteriales bacterium]|nr:DUF5716 family protein [Eubacteriales bacterium]
MHLFQVVPDGFFKPLSSKYKATYVDCLMLIYNTYRAELSFGVDKEVIIEVLERYFDDQSTSDLVFDEENAEIARDSRAKANVIIRNLIESGWLYLETVNNFKIKVNLFDYSATMIETFDRVTRSDEMEYQSLVSQIHATLVNQEGYVKPYEYIIKRVHENTEELIAGLKKLNTSIRKYIEAITHDKSAAEIVQDFFIYNKDIGSKSYHRIKTSDNISHFRNAILERLGHILHDEVIFNRAVLGCRVVEQLPDDLEASRFLRGRILDVMTAFRNYDEIIAEIDYKHSRYMGSAVARAKFLLTNTNNAEGKISRILADLAKAFNETEDLDLKSNADLDLVRIFNIFPQTFIDNESLHTMPISRKITLPEILGDSLGLSVEERALRNLAIQEKSRSRFSHKNINQEVKTRLESNPRYLASAWPLETRHDLIRLIFINLYGRDHKSYYKITPLEGIVAVNGFQFRDFLIEKRE